MADNLFYLLSALVQWVSGVFLGLMGVCVVIDFRAWYRTQYPDSDSRMAALVLLAIYLAALAVFRWVH